MNSSRRKLTSAFVKSVKPKNKRVLYWDATQFGLALQVEPSGHKSYKLVYRCGGRTRWYTIARADAIGLADARSFAEQQWAKIIQGTDIQAEKMAARMVATFEELAERYRDEYAKKRNKSWKQADTLVRSCLSPKWGKLRVQDITRSDVRTMFRHITDAGSPVMANQVLAAASAIFSWAIQEEVVELSVNPCIGIERNPTKARERVLSDAEVPLFWIACDDVDLVRGRAFLLQEEMAREVIDLLRPRSVLRAIGPQVVRPRRGALDFPKITSGATAAYVGENEDISVSQPVFGQINLSAKKLAALVPISNDLLKYGSDDADRIIRDDMILEIAKVEDINLIRGDGLEGAPRGLRYWAATANVTASNGTTASNIEKDFKDLIQALEGNDVPMIRPAWIMAPRLKNHLITLRDANGNLIYPDMRSITPTIHTFPAHVTNNIPTTLGGGGDETEIYLVHASEVIFGEVEAVEVTVSGDASYTSDGSLVSSFTRDQTLIRAVLRHDLAAKHQEAVGVKTAVT